MCYVNKISEWEYYIINNNVQSITVRSYDIGNVIKETYI